MEEEDERNWGKVSGFRRTRRGEEIGRNEQKMKSQNANRGEEKEIGRKVWKQGRGKEIGRKIWRFRG